LIEIVRFIIDKVGGIGAVVGSGVGLYIWNSGDKLDCTGFGAQTRCVYGLRFLGGLWTEEVPFVGMFTFTGALLYLGGKAIIKDLGPGS
jgi:hypothetical protein